MTIRPAPTAFLMVCDDCDHERPVEDIAGIDWACERIGWMRIVTGRQDMRGPVVGHLCPRCAAIATAPPAAPQHQMEGLA